MNGDSPLSPDDLLTRAETGLRQAPLEEGPSREALDRTIAALRAAESAPPVVPFFRRPRVRSLAKIAAVFVVAATAVFGVNGWLHFRPAVAFGEVAQKLHDAKTLIYRMRVESPDLKNPHIAKVYVKGRDLERMESAEGVSIVNRAQGKSLALDPNEKTAIVFEVKRAGPRAHAHEVDQEALLDHLRNLADSEGQPAGQKEIAGRKALGFRAKEGQLDWLIWADAQTKEPLTAEASSTGGIKVTLSDFELNRPLDDSLFSLEIPEGYKSRKANFEVRSGEESLTRLLQSYAETADKAFPPRLDDWPAIGKHFREAREKNGQQPNADKLSPEFVQLVSSVSGVAAFLLPLEQYTYRPEGAKLGDAQMIFWYQPAENKKYRALHADLHWSEVSADELPEFIPHQTSHQ